ncbi:type IV pilus modification PilV family protein [Thermotomaculum hydrothermale]|nr:prepilin-type N-terminal cleavage/methylation domain-containing protein [Thermotomaculum hydrothermale]
MNNRGFTLIETVISIVIVSVAIVGILSVIYNVEQKGIDPVMELKACELGQAMLDEIMLKRWDEDTPLGGGHIDTSLANIGTESGESNREDFDDVDDYDGYSDGTSSEPLKDEEGNVLSGFTGFSRSVTVSFEKPNGAPSGIDVKNYKKVTVKVTLPTGEEINFVSYKTNI